MGRRTARLGTLFDKPNPVSTLPRALCDRRDGGYLCRRRRRTLRYYGEQFQFCVSRTTAGTLEHRQGVTFAAGVSRNRVLRDQRADRRAGTAVRTVCQLRASVVRRRHLQFDGARDAPAFGHAGLAGMPPVRDPRLRRSSHCHWRGARLRIEGRGTAALLSGSVRTGCEVAARPEDRPDRKRH